MVQCSNCDVHHGLRRAQRGESENASGHRRSVFIGTAGKEWANKGLPRVAPAGFAFLPPLDAERRHGATKSLKMHYRGQLGRVQQRQHMPVVAAQR